MPYENEYAQYKPLRRIAESERVKKLLGNYKVKEQSERVDLPSLNILSRTELEQSEWEPNWVLAIDGSHAEVVLQNGYPGAEAAYVTVASVLIDTLKIRELDEHRPVDPQIFKTVEQAEAIDCALPGCNVVYDGEQSAKTSFRRAIFEIFSEERLAEDSETLLDTYEVLLKYKPDTRNQRCPFEDCPDDNAVYQPKMGTYPCTCTLKLTNYSTDALRIHERMNPAGSNGAIFSEVMQVLERIWLIHILRVFEEKGLLSVLKRVAIVIDGPLAVFGQPAWLSDAIQKELNRINALVKSITGKDILLVGIEKTGTFVEHFTQIDTNEDGSVGRFPQDSVLLLTDQYIKQHIIFSESNRPYGYATYFGRKLLYKTFTGAMIVAVFPFLDETHQQLSTATPNQFPRLVDGLNLLNQLVSSRYTNSITPLVSAHSEASIPLHLGNKVLEKLAKEIIGEQRK
jgi:hypothetical protein